MKGEKIPWDELSRHQRESFAALCETFVGVDTVSDAKKYYGNRIEMFKDKKEVDDE